MDLLGEGDVQGVRVTVVNLGYLVVAEVWLVVVELQVAKGIVQALSLLVLVAEGVINVVLAAVGVQVAVVAVVHPIEDVTIGDKF